MKKLVFLFALMIILFSCEEYNEQFEGYDNNVITQVENVEVTLSEDDYSAIGGDPKKYNNFSKNAPAKDYLPAFLKGKYPALDKSSVAMVTYNYYMGSLSYLRSLTKATNYELEKADYNSFGEGKGFPGYYDNFDSKNPPENYLPNFFVQKYPDAKDGDLVYVTYKYYSKGIQIRSDYYKFDGTNWATTEIDLPDGISVYTLNKDDYDSMGEERNQPGKYNNFSGSISPADYLGKFLGIKFPYAKEGSKIAVLYKYYKGGGKTETRATEYSLRDKVWMAYSSTITKTDQYIHTGENGWLYDPSQVLTMGADDFQMIVDYVKTNVGAEYVDKYGTSEIYYGAGAYYINFDLRSGKWDASTFSTWQDAVKEGIAKGFLPFKFPSAVTSVSGVEVMYVVTFATYDGGAGEYTFAFKCTKAAPNPTFEFVEER